MVLSNTMKIVSWNVNGLRAVHRKGCWGDFMSLKADIICLQEIKAEEQQLPHGAQYIPGYETLINSSKVKKGYSGVAIYTKEVPETVQHGMGVEKFDGEGRVLTVHFKDFTLCNIYFPNGGMSKERLQFKLDFYDEFLSFVENIRKKQPNIIFCGDVNTAHNEIDLARPKANSNRTGFLDIEREWIDEVVNTGYADVYRYFYPDKSDMYTWWDMKTRARDRNVGWRIDYFFASSAALKRIKDTKIHPEIFGSDHCPLSIELDL